MAQVTDLQTSSISLSQVPLPSPSVLPASSSSASSTSQVFRAINRVSFQAPVDIAGEVLDAAVNAGANQILSVSLMASDSDGACPLPSINPHRRGILIRPDGAVANAQEQATRLAVDNAFSYGRLLLSQLGCNAVNFGDVSLSPVNTPLPSSINSYARPSR